MNKRKAIDTSRILASTPKKEAVLYKVDFSTGEFSVHSKNSVVIESTKEAIQEYMKTGTDSVLSNHKRNDMSHLRYEAPVKKKNPSTIDFKAVLIYTASFLLLCFSLNSFARGPEGEYSALVEQNLTREDFKTDEEAKAFVKTRDIEISHELQDDREVVESRTIEAITK